MKKIIVFLSFISLISCAKTMSPKTNSIEGGWVSKPLDSKTFYVAYEGDYLTSSTTAEQLALDTAQKSCLKLGTPNFKIIDGNTTSSQLQLGAFTASLSVTKATASYIIECTGLKSHTNLVNYNIINTPINPVIPVKQLPQSINKQRFNKAWSDFLGGNNNINK